MMKSAFTYVRRHILVLCFFMVLSAGYLLIPVVILLVD